MTTTRPTASESMVFYDNYEAPLKAGAYRFVLQQTITLEGEAARHYYRDQRFEVLAPRYTVDGDELQAHFPPPGGVADYENALPHLVLRTRNLPWEREVWSGEGGEPWLALLVLSEQEIVEGRVAVKTATVADLAPSNSSSDVWTRTEGDQGVLLPKFTREEDPATPVRLLDIDLKLFLALCPRRKELPLLAHIRRVDTADKVPSEMVADGEFAVLVANRFPQPGANTVHLVSLEGLGDLIEARGGQPPATPPTRLRLITLGSWGFVSDPTGSDTFGGLMRGLRESAAVFAAKGRAPGGDAYVNQALARGYVPVDYQPAESTPAFAWYRGPLAPLTRPSLGRPPFRDADSALIFDERTGLMDVSYAAAWQLGRLLALSSPAFAKGLRLFVERSRNAADFARQVDAFISLHRSAFEDLSEGGAPRPGGAQIAVADELVEWIARAVLLYPVPFHYLVPHPQLLPPESLRFFHLDDNWVDALVDGALSIAVRSLADQGLASRADMQSALSRIVYQHRLRMQGKRPEWQPSERYKDVKKSGFLLRSSLVTGWPGVEVTATTATESEVAPDPNLPEILRLDQIADGVLFCLARGQIKQVTFREPREALTFGVDSDGAVTSQATRETFNVRPDMLRADARAGVVDIAALGSRLSGKPKTGSADFASRMIRMPEEQVIKWA